MKTKILLLVFGLALIVGCNTTQQRVAYNTIATIEQTATLAVDDYFTLVINGTIKTNSVPVVSKSFNYLQAAGKLAADASESGTNALAPSSLVIEATDLGNLISTVEKTDKK